MELLNPTLKNKKKSTLTKFLIFQEMEISNIFSKESFSYFPGNGNLEKISCISGTKLSYILGYGNPKKNFYISGENSRARKNVKKQKTLLKCLLYFGKWNFFIF